MKELRVHCPQCASLCEIDLAEADLEEDCTSEAFEGECAECGCDFSFDVAVDILNKRIE